MEIGFFGATGTVTGSRYLVKSKNSRVLVDCGLFQGYKQLRERNWAEPPFDPTSLDAVLLTHAHLDHSGYLPLLVKNGFRGRVYCTEATRALCAILLPDSGRLQEEQAESANRHRQSKHIPALPLYTEKDALRALEHLEGIPFDQELRVANDFRACFLPAGHILGAAMIRLHDAKTRILFSGDLGRPHDAIMQSPAEMPETDYLVIESTYGNRLHDTQDPHLQFGEIIRRTAARGGVVIVPSFAVGRTQSLLWCIHRLKSEGLIPAQLPVYLNSPMAIDVTAIYHQHRSEHRLTPEQCDAMCHAAHYINSIEESRALNERPGPMIIIAGSGMATGGRVVHHLKAFAPDPRNTVVFAGYQAGGTRGAAMLAHAAAIRIHGENVPLRAEVAAISALSAHADYGEILAWLGRAKTAPRRTFITHGEPDAADALRWQIQDKRGWRCSVPTYLDSVVLGDE
ncbi:MAG: MBL fold metallo-hydrolase RNA specificity domain-containing protein [Pseudomonadota bacterium]